jgi:hypothetical protein
MSDFGITKISGTLIESVDCEEKAELKELITSTGTHSAARIVDVTFSFSVKGKGSCPVVAGDNGGAPDGVSGHIIITNATDSQTNDDWAGFSYSGTAYKYAS